MSKWKTVRLGEICEQINGVSYKPADVYDSLTEKATILLRANNIFEDKLNYDELVFVDKKRISENQYMKKGDILICASSGSKHLVGKAACLTEDKDLTFGAFCKVLRPKTVNPEYIKHYFFSPSYRTEISRLSEGANINNIKAADLDNLKIPLPSESIQNKIAKRLDKCVKIINNQRKALEKYDILIKSRFIEMFGDPKINSSNLPTKKFIEVVKLQRGFDLPVQERNQDGLFNVYGSNGPLDKHDSFKVKAPGIVTGRSGTLGNVYYVLEDYWPLNTTLFSVDIHNNNVVYLKYLLELYDLSRFSEGAGVPTLNRNIVHDKDIIDVPLSLQNQFADFVQQIDKSKFAVQKSLEKAETLYKSLMQEYFA